MDPKNGQFHDKNADVSLEPARNDFLVPMGRPERPRNDHIHFCFSFFAKLVPEVVLNRSGKSWLFHDFGGPFSAIRSGIDFSSISDEKGIQKPTFYSTI